MHEPDLQDSQIMLEIRNKFKEEKDKNIYQKPSKVPKLTYLRPTLLMITLSISLIALLSSIYTAFTFFFYQ